MKRRLIVLRHAKSAWGTEAPSDHARPLNKRGRRDAPRVAARLADLDWIPERVISSDSQRTRETWAGMSTALDEPSVRFTRGLYHGGLDEVRDEVEGVATGVTTLMVIGHNPGWEDMASRLTGTYLTMTTCNAALLEVEADTWGEALAMDSCWHMYEHVKPREL